MPGDTLGGMTIEERNGFRVQRLDDDGPLISSDADTSDLFGNAWYAKVDLLVIPTSRLDRSFFDLSSRHAGEVLRKAVNYGVRLAVVGDITRDLAKSEALADFVWEANRGDHVWFLPDDAAVEARLLARES